MPFKHAMMPDDSFEVHGTDLLYQVVRPMLECDTPTKALSCVVEDTYSDKMLDGTMAPMTMYGKEVFTSLLLALRHETDRWSIRAYKNKRLFTTKRLYTPEPDGFEVFLTPQFCKKSLFLTVVRNCEKLMIGLHYCADDADEAQAMDWLCR